MKYKSLIIFILFGSYVQASEPPKKVKLEFNHCIRIENNPVNKWINKLQKIMKKFHENHGKKTITISGRRA